MRSKELKQLKCPFCIIVRLRNNLGMSLCPIWKLSVLVCVIWNDLLLNCCLVPPGGACLTYFCRVMDFSESCGLQLLRIMAVILRISQVVGTNFVFLIWGNSVWRVLGMGNLTCFWHFLAEASLLKLPFLEKNCGCPLKELDWGEEYVACHCLFMHSGDWWMGYHRFYYNCFS